MPRSNRLFESLAPATRERLRPHIDVSWPSLATVETFPVTIEDDTIKLEVE